MQELHNKFVDLERRQRDKLMQGQTDPESPWAGLRGDEVTAENRYPNVKPYVNNRVKLGVGEGEDDYINASPIVLGSQKYIAAEGPTETTANHFWRMIVELQVGEPVVVVMLTQTQEAGNENSFQYYPLTLDDSPMSIPPNISEQNGFAGKILLDRVHLLDTARSELRALTLESQSSPDTLETLLNVYHVSFGSWPDFSIREGDDRAALVELIRLSNRLTWPTTQEDTGESHPSLNELDAINLHSFSPRVIHCSAGVGHTGTFIALDHLLYLLFTGLLDDIPDETDPVVETVDRLRQHRMGLVEGEVQFNFIYDLLREEWERGASSHAAKRKADHSQGTWEYRSWENEREI